ncbi:MAG TPA: ABC transporter ATP-binding protein, partial [Alphaproteobacteria bacterium]|nr:ABC transporter ATP-binding protein [Alphaproteobacteria bacterium]
MRPTTKKYAGCIKDILLKTFEDKQLLFYFFVALLILSIGIIANISLPFLLKKIVESLFLPECRLIPLILMSYGLLWMVSQASVHARGLLTYKIEQRLTFVLGIKVLSHLYSLSHHYFLNQKPGAMTNVIRRAQRDVPSITLGLFFHVLPTVLEFVVVIILISHLY